MERIDASSTVLAINYDIGAWGGLTHAFTDGDNWLSQDWTSHNALRFWLYGNNTGGTIQVEIFDNRNPNLNSDTTERWFYRITDDYDSWMAFTIPFRSFQRRTDWQPGGAPDVNLDEGFHVYAIDWDPYVIRWYLDGELTNLVSVNALDGKQWIYDHDFFLLMNLAVGGYWPGYPDEMTEFPQEMIVDYLRVYQLQAE